MTVLWTDVSKHDWNRKGGPLDWSKILPATSRCMCARLTYGDPAGYNPTSPHGVEMVQAARAAGADLRGGYHNLIKGDQASINRQVDYLRREADQAGANWVMCDVERYAELVSNGLWPRWDDVRQFHDRWYQVDDRVMAWYIPGWLWENYLGRPDLRVLHGPLVESDYGANTNGNPWTVYQARGGDGGRGYQLYGGRSPEGWQFGSKLDVNGASADTDVNAFRGTYPQLQALLTPAANPEEDDMDSTERQWLERTHQRVSAIQLMQDTADMMGEPDEPVEIVAAVKALQTGLAALNNTVAELVAVPPGSVAITDEQLDRVAGKVADLLAARLQN